MKNVREVSTGNEITAQEAINKGLTNIDVRCPECNEFVSLNKKGHAEHYRESGPNCSLRSKKY